MQFKIVLAVAVPRLSVGAGQLLPFLEDRGVVLSASGVQTIPNRHQLGRRRQRIAALAQAAQWARHGIRVNALAPGRTPWWMTASQMYGERGGRWPSPTNGD